LLDMYTKIQRRIQIGQHIGKPFPSNRVSGQGDSLSLFAALAITTIQSRYINAHCASVKLGSVTDDRNFRGPCRGVIHAVQLASKFDDDAGFKQSCKICCALYKTPLGADIPLRTAHGTHLKELSRRQVVTQQYITYAIESVRTKQKREIVKT